jgi:hypothetical protein
MRDISLQIELDAGTGAAVHPPVGDYSSGDPVLRSIV